MKAKEALALTDKANSEMRHYDEAILKIQEAAGNGRIYVQLNEDLNDPTCMKLATDGYYVYEALGGTFIAWGNGYRLGFYIKNNSKA